MSTYPIEFKQLKEENEQLEAENKRLKETINYAIGGIEALLPDNEDAKAIKETLEQGVK